METREQATTAQCLRNTNKKETNRKEQNTTDLTEKKMLSKIALHSVSH